MDFISAVTKLNHQKIIKRTAWDDEFMVDDCYLIKDEYGYLKKIVGTDIKDYKVTEEDALGIDWIEAEKKTYVLDDIEIKDGMQFFILQSPSPNRFSRFEFKNLLRYIQLDYEKYIEEESQYNDPSEPEVYEAYMSWLQQEKDTHEERIAGYKREVDNLLFPMVAPFKYDFTRCPICDSPMKVNGEDISICPTGCIEYEIDVLLESVMVTLFNAEFEDECFWISLFEDSWNATKKELKVNVQKLQEAILYWRQYDRYKERILAKKELPKQPRVHEFKKQKRWD